MDWNKKYTEMNETFQRKYERPVIGITGNYDAPNSLLGEAYYKSVLRAGGTPVIIPPFRMEGDSRFNEQLKQYLDRIDGIIFSGGADLNPL